MLLKSRTLTEFSIGTLNCVRTRSTQRNQKLWREGDRGLVAEESHTHHPQPQPQPQPPYLCPLTLLEYTHASTDGARAMANVLLHNDVLTTLDFGIPLSNTKTI